MRGVDPGQQSAGHPHHLPGAAPAPAAAPGEGNTRLSLADTLSILASDWLLQTSVVTTQLAVDTDHPEPGLGELRTWLLSTL